MVSADDDFDARLKAVAGGYRPSSSRFLRSVANETPS
jgi:hypothetical protein